MSLRKHNIFVFILLVLTGFLDCDESTDSSVSSATEKPIFVEYKQGKETEVLVSEFILVVSIAILSVFLTIASFRLHDSWIEFYYRELIYWRIKRRMHPHNSWRPRVDYSDGLELHSITSEFAQREKRHLERMKAEELEFFNESKFRNNGTIEITTQNIMIGDLAIGFDKKPVEKTIKQVKWSTDPTVFYEIGQDVDRFDTVVDAKGGGFSSSSVMTASIKKI